MFRGRVEDFVGEGDVHCDVLGVSHYIKLTATRSALLTNNLFAMTFVLGAPISGQL